MCMCVCVCALMRVYIYIYKYVYIYIYIYVREAFGVYLARLLFCWSNFSNISDSTAKFEIVEKLL